MVVHQDYRDVLFNCTEELLAIEIAETLNKAWLSDQRKGKKQGFFPLDKYLIANDN